MTLSILFDEDWLEAERRKEAGLSPVTPAPKKVLRRKAKRSKRGRRPSRHVAKTKYQKENLKPQN
jgi:hypothetical protein